MDSSVKSVWIINQHIDSPYFNGDGHRHHYLAEMLSDKGYQVTLITCSDTHVPRKSLPIKGNYRIIEGEKYNILIVKTNKYQKALSVGRIYSMFNFTIKLLFIPFKKLDTPDYVVVSSLSLPPLLSGLYFRKKFKTKNVLEIRDIWPLSVIELGGYSKYHPFLLLLSIIEKIGYAKYDYLVSLLPKANTHFSDILEGRAFKYKHISNGISVEEASMGEELDSSVADILAKHKFVVGYAGSIGEANAMDSFVEAALSNINPDIHFCMVGEGYLKEQLMSKCNGDFSNITFINRIPKNQVASLLQHFDVLYLSWKDVPIYRFGVSANKLFDYMYAGKPIIQSGNIADDPVKLSNCGLVVEPENSSAIIDAVNLIYEMTDLERAELGQNGKDYVLQHFTYDRLSDLYIEVFEELS